VVVVSLHEISEFIMALTEEEAAASVMAVVMMADFLMIHLLDVDPWIGDFESHYLQNFAHRVRIATGTYF